MRSFGKHVLLRRGHVYSPPFWKEISSWLRKCGIDTLPDLTNQVNIMFGLFDAKSHFMLLNHIVLIAKQTIFFCRRKKHYLVVSSG